MIGALPGPSGGGASPQGPEFSRRLAAQALRQERGPRTWSSGDRLCGREMTRLRERSARGLR
ncbi:MAG: hypothetical protein LBT40_03030 [Deltaproteobacteria bacterium]|nr:hypothetical protein [Deltaproteobacteria bacterium]